MIRPAKSNDYKTLVSLFTEENIHNHKVAPERVAKTKNVLTTSELNDFISNPQWYLSVFVENNKIVGVILASHKFKEATRWNPETNIVYIEELIVAEQHRRKGIGSALYKDVVSWAEKVNSSTLDLHVWANNLASIQFYKSLGFKSKQHLMSATICS